MDPRPKCWHRLISTTTDAVKNKIVPNWSSIVPIFLNYEIAINDITKFIDMINVCISLNEQPAKFDVGMTSLLTRIYVT